MTSNVGKFDRTSRAILGFAFILAPMINLLGIWQSPVLAYGAIAVGIVLILTAAFRFCPLYRLIGVSTCKSGA